jgi:small-conductance mechanosensitive channel
LRKIGSRFSARNPLCTWDSWAVRRAAIPKVFLTALAWLALTLAAPAVVHAQAHSPAAAPRQAAAGASSPGDRGGAMDARLDKAEAQLRAIRVGIRPRSLDDTALNEQQAAVAPIQADLNDALANLTPRLQDAQARLAELGPARAAGQPPEPADVAANRVRLAKLQANLDGNSKRARLLTVEASQLNDSIAARLRRNFTARLWTRSRSILDPFLWRDFAVGLPGDLMGLLAALAPSRPLGAGSGLMAAILAALGLVLLGPLRIVLARLGRAWATRLLPSAGLRKSALALWLAAAGTLTPFLAGLLLREALFAWAPRTPVTEGLARAVIGALVTAGLIEALGLSLLAPGRPSWRLAPVSDAVVGRLAVFPVLIGTVVGLVSLASHADDALEVSAATTVAIDCLSVVAELAVLGFGLLRLGRARSDHAAAAGEHEAGPRSRLPWILAAVAAWLALGVALAAVLGGYLALATFVMQEVIGIGVVLASLFLLMQFADDLSQALFSPEGLLGRLFQTAIGLSENALEQIGVLLSGLLRLTLLLFGWMAIVAPFGTGMREMLARVTSTRMVLKLGQLSISPGLILGAMAVFGLGLLVTRLIRGWLEGTYLPKTRIDLGVRTSITAGLGYLGALIAVLMTCAYLGLSLDRIALFASALSVGIGFGLQAVIGNFVSGLILLAERPVKVGDWIAIGDQEGDVKRINIRATEIEMGDRSKLIVPNSDLISKTVRNVTRGGALGQVKIVIRVANDADAGQVRDLLLARITAHGEVLREPAAGVYLTALPDGALEFTCVAAVASARQAFRIKSELLFAMVAALKDADVRLANSQTVIQLAAEAPAKT